MKPATFMLGSSRWGNQLLPDIRPCISQTISENKKECWGWGLGRFRGEKRDRGRDFKVLVHMIVKGFMRPKSDGVGWQAGDSGKSCSSSLKAVS